MSAPEACEHIRIFPVLVGSCGIPFPAFFHHSGKVRIPGGKEPFHLFLRRAVRSFRADELGIEERIDPVRLRALYDGIEECGGICAIHGLGEQPVLPACSECLRAALGFIVRWSSLNRLKIVPERILPLCYICKRFPHLALRRVPEAERRAEREDPFHYLQALLPPLRKEFILSDDPAFELLPQLLIYAEQPGNLDADPLRIPVLPAVLEHLLEWPCCMHPACAVLLYRIVSGEPVRHHVSREFHAPVFVEKLTGRAVLWMPCRR